MKEKVQPDLERCVFFNRLGIEPDPNPCGGKITNHHVVYRREGGNENNGNIVSMCEGHQRFVHSKNKWGNENFSNI